MAMTPEEKTKRKEWPGLEPVVTFSIGGKPQEQKRHRHRVIQSKGKKPFASTYDPCAKEKKSFSTLAAQFAPAAPIQGPVGLLLYCYMPYANTHMGTGRNAKKPKPSAPEYHTKTPDVDNLAKFVMDALTGLFWKDDSQIISLTVVKTYSTDPKTVVIVMAEEKIIGGA